MKVVIAGANGHLGQRLIAHLGADRVRAIVRSERARAMLVERFGDGLDTRICDYTDAAQLTTAMEGFEVLVHLVGIIKESKSNPFTKAHEESCRAVTAAAEGARLRHIVYLSLTGARTISDNPCFESRAVAEGVLLDGAVPVTILRVPMVLGERDYASLALSKQAKRLVAFTFRASSLEQPIYAGDVIDAIVASMEGTTHRCFALAGPESLPRRKLIHRAAAVLGKRGPLVISLPLALGLIIARIAERADNPPVTRAMLGVLDHDDDVDSAPVVAKLGISLTSLDETLKKVIE